MLTHRFDESRALGAGSGGATKMRKILVLLAGLLMATAVTAPPAEFS